MMKEVFLFRAITMHMELFTVILNHRYQTGQFSRKERKLLRKLVLKIYRWSLQLLHEMSRK